MMGDILHVVLAAFVLPIAGHDHIVEDVCVKASSYPQGSEWDPMLSDYFSSSSILSHYRLFRSRPRI
jgi:hypothetical protein